MLKFVFFDCKFKICSEVCTIKMKEKMKIIICHMYCKMWNIPAERTSAKF